MRKIIVILLALSLAFAPMLIAKANADARHGMIASTKTSSTAGIVSGGVWVYGIKIYASAASARMAICDSATTCESANVYDEIGTATQYNSDSVMYSKPVYFSNGISMWIGAGTGTVYYGGPPD